MKQNNNKRKKTLNKILYRKKDLIIKEAKDYLILIISSFILTFSYDYFISATTQYGIFPAGIGGLARISAIYTTADINKQNVYYFVYLFVLNLPLFIFSIIKLSVKFSLKTLLYIAMQSIFNLIIMSTPINPNNFHILINYGLLAQSSTSMDYQLWLFIFAIMGGITYGYACGLSYSVNGSTGGTDFISMYFSIKKRKSIGNISRYINIGVVLFVMILQSIRTPISEFYLIYPNTDLTRNEYIIKFLFGPSMFASLLTIIISNILINVTFPKYEYRTLFIITKKSDLVIKSMRKIGAVINDISVWDAVNTQLDEKQDIKGYKIIMSTITLIEFRKVKRSIMITDPYARIFLQKVDRIAGTYQIKNLI